MVWYLVKHRGSTFSSFSGYISLLETGCTKFQMWRCLRFVPFGVPLYDANHYYSNANKKFPNVALHPLSGKKHSSYKVRSITTVTILYQDLFYFKFVL